MYKCICIYMCTYTICVMYFVCNVYLSISMCVNMCVNMCVFRGHSDAVTVSVLPRWQWVSHSAVVHCFSFLTVKGKLGSKGNLKLGTGVLYSPLGFCLSLWWQQH